MNASHALMTLVLPRRRRGDAMPWAASWAASWGDLRGALVGGLLTLVTTISYGAVAGAPFGPWHAAAVALSGLVAASLGSTVASLIGPAPTQIFSPRASVAVVVASAAASFGASPSMTPTALAHAVGMLWLCLLLAGLMQLALAGLRLGGLIRLIPHSVSAGIVIAIAIKLALSQLPGLGLVGIGWPAPAPLAVGLATLAVIVLGRWQRRPAAGTLLGLVAGLAAAAIVERLMPGTVLPRLQAIDGTQGPLLSFSALAGFFQEAGLAQVPWPGLLAFSAMIALVNSIETLTSALLLEDMGACRFDPNRALLAAACGSLVALAAGGLPVAGSTSGSSAAVRAGARSRWAALGGAGLVAIGTLAFGAGVARVPVGVVAALMLAVAIELIYEPARELLKQWRHHRHGLHGELAVVLIVCALMLAADILTALAGGVVVATAFAFVQMRAKLIRRQYDASEAGLPAPLRALVGAEAGRDIQVIELGQPLFFATVEAAVRAIDRMAASTRVAVLDLGRDGAMDLTAAKALARCALALADAGQRLIVVGGSQLAAFDAELAPCRLFTSVDDALNHCLTNTPAHAGLSEPANGPQRRGAARELDMRAAAATMRSEGAGRPTPALLAHATRLLTAHIGPIATIVVARAAGVAAHREQLCRLLAGQIEERADRKAFLVRMRTWREPAQDRRPA